MCDVGSKGRTMEVELRLTELIKEAQHSACLSLKNVCTIDIP